MPTVVIDLSVGLGADTKTGRITATGDGGILNDITLTASQANKAVDLTFKQTDLAAGALVFFSDKAVVVKTNSSSVPDDTFNVPANGYYHVRALTEDIDSLFITNSAAAEALVSIRGAKDVTP